MAATVLSGIVFGAALTASGVYHPYTIVSQLKLEDWSMMQTFLTASATSGIVVSIFRFAKLVKLNPEPYTTVGLFARSDGNILGGAFLGAGMALCGSCPGTVLAQIGAGVPSALPTFLGAATGGVLWSGWLQPQIRSAIQKQGSSSEVVPVTVDRLLGISPLTAVVAFEAIIAAVVASLVMLTDKGRAAGLVAPVIGGLLIGGAQLVSLAVRKGMLGASTAYEEAPEYLLWLTGALKGKTPKGEYLPLASGIMIGAFAVSTLFPSVTDAPSLAIPAIQSAIGGFLMLLGARMGDGCPSGHGISGMSLLSVSSVITTALMLASGFATARLIA